MTPEDMKQLQKELHEATQDFIRLVNEQKWSTELRTRAETIVILAQQLPGQPHEAPKKSSSSGPYYTVASKTFPERMNIEGPTEVGGAMAPALAADRCRQLNDAFRAGRYSTIAELDKVQQPGDSVLMDYQPFSLEESNTKEGYYTKIVTRGGVICMTLQPNPTCFTYGRKFGDAVVRALNASIPKAQQPGKVLTDNEIQRIWEAGAKAWRSELRHGIEQAWVVGWCLRYVRDNGYLAPAAGLTVEEIDSALAPVFQAIDWGQTNYAYTLLSGVRNRLTAAINAKQKP